jgi:hypothetical protein
MVLRNLIILPKAELDATQAYTWYEEQEFGLGEEFLSCLDLAFNCFGTTPKCIRGRTKNIEGRSCDASPTLFSMSIQILQLLSMQFFTVLKTRKNGVVGCHKDMVTVGMNWCVKAKSVCRR